MQAPQIIMIILFAVGITASIYQHGSPQKDNNMWSDFISHGIMLGLLIWGGFFK